MTSRKSVSSIKYTIFDLAWPGIWPELLDPTKQTKVTVSAQMLYPLIPNQIYEPLDVAG